MEKARTTETLTVVKTIVVGAKIEIIEIGYRVKKEPIGQKTIVKLPTRQSEQKEATRGQQ